MFVLGQWANETFTLICSLMSVTALAAHTIARNIVMIFYMVPVGISMAASILVGMKVGSRNVKEAKIFAKMSVLSAFIWGLFFMVLMMVIRPFLTSVFTTSKEVNDLVN